MRISMKNFFDGIIADRITRTATILSVLLIFITLIYTLLIYAGLPPYIPIFNQLGWGDPRLGENYLIFLPILLSLGVVILNIFLASLAYTAMPLISRIITITSLLVSALTLIFVIRITLLVL